MALGNYRCTNMVLKITYSGTEYTLGVVEGLDISLGFEGSPEAVYGTRIKKHGHGSKAASFTITRWFYADLNKPDAPALQTSQEALLLDLFDGEVEFTLEGSLITNANVDIPNTSITLTGCMIYRWRPRTGGADDIIGEEASGYATDWTLDVLPSVLA